MTEPELKPAHNGGFKDMGCHYLNTIIYLLRVDADPASGQYFVDSLGNYRFSEEDHGRRITVAWELDGVPYTKDIECSPDRLRRPCPPKLPLTRKMIHIHDGMSRKARRAAAKNRQRLGPETKAKGVNCRISPP